MRGHGPEPGGRHSTEGGWFGGLDPVNTVFVSLVLVVILATVGYIVWTSVL
jgi:hypothetical protein